MRPLSFLFDGDDREIQQSFNSCILRRLFAATLEHASSAMFDVRIGTLPLTHFTYGIEAVERKEIAGRLSTSHTLADNKDLRKALAVDFAQAAVARWSRLDPEHIPAILLTHNVECLTISDIDEVSGEKLHKALKQPGYIGCFEVDLGNPVLTQLVIGLLPTYYRYVPRKLQLLRSPWDDDGVGAEWASDLPLDAIEISMDPPASIARSELSERGKASVRLISERGRTTHSQRVLSALLEEWEIDRSTNNGEEAVRFGSAEKGSPVADVRKLRDYALNEGHPVGKHKARLFRELLGVTKDDWRFIAEQLVAGLQRALIERPRKSAYGVQYHVEVPVRGRNGATKLVTTGWIIKVGEPPRLTTALIAKSADTSDRSSLADYLVNPSDGWQALLDAAHAAGTQAANKWTPTPMFIAGGSIAVEGECGTAWVDIKDGRSSFARWLRKNGHAHPGYKRGVSIFASTSTQSVERARKYCEAFATVLRANGIDCDTDSRLD